MNTKYENLAKETILQIATNRGSAFLQANVSELSISRGNIVGVKIVSPERDGTSLNLGIGQGGDASLFFDDEGTYQNKIGVDRTVRLLRESISSSFVIQEEHKDRDYIDVSRSIPDKYQLAVVAQIDTLRSHLLFVNS